MNNNSKLSVIHEANQESIKSLSFTRENPCFINWKYNPLFYRNQITQ
jgi:hypothetical protein